MAEKTIPVHDQGNVLARLDRLTVPTRLHWGWVLLLFGATFYELADIPTFSLTAPTIKEQWDLSVGEIGVLTSMTFLGMFFGAVAGGMAGDRIGRKWTLVWSLLVCSLSTLASAATNDAVSLGVCRFLTGAGVAATAVA